MGFKTNLVSFLRNQNRRERRRGRGREEEEKIGRMREVQQAKRYGSYDFCMELGIDLNRYMFVGCGL